MALQLHLTKVQVASGKMNNLISNVNVTVQDYEEGELPSDECQEPVTQSAPNCSFNARKLQLVSYKPKRIIQAHSKPTQNHTPLQKEEKIAEPEEFIFQTIPHNNYQKDYDQTRLRKEKKIHKNGQKQTRDKERNSNDRERERERPKNQRNDRNQRKGNSPSQQKETPIPYNQPPNPQMYQPNMMPMPYYPSPYMPMGMPTPMPPHPMYGGYPAPYNPYPQPMMYGGMPPPMPGPMMYPPMGMPIPMIQSPNQIGQIGNPQMQMQGKYPLQKSNYPPYPITEQNYVNPNYHQDDFRNVRFPNGNQSKTLPQRDYREKQRDSQGRPLQNEQIGKYRQHQAPVQTPKLDPRKQELDEVKKQLRKTIKHLSQEEKQEVLEIVRGLTRHFDKSQVQSKAIYEENLEKLDTLMSNSQKIKQSIEKVNEKGQKTYQQVETTRKDIIIRVLELLQLKEALSKIKERKIFRKLVSEKQQSEMKRLLDILVRDPRKIIK